VFEVYNPTRVIAAASLLSFSSGAIGLAASEEAMKRVLSTLLGAGLLVMLTATGVLAQATAQITGTVKDPSGGVLPVPCQEVVFRNADGNDPPKQELVLLSCCRREA